MSSGGASRHSFFVAARRRFFSDAQGWFGVIGILLLLIPAIAAPLLANGRPLVVWGGEKGVYFPFAAFLFAPDSTEFLIEQFFNFTLLVRPVVVVSSRPVAAQCMRGGNLLRHLHPCSDTFLANKD